MYRALVVLCLMVTFGPAVAQSFPVKPVRIIVPYTPGGDTDVVARLVAPKLGEALGQQVIVENRPGAGSLIGTEAMLRAPADGYTLAVGTISSLAVLPVTKTNVPYDPLRDIAPIVLATVAPYVLHVHPSIPARSVTEFVKFARARPGQISYGTPGIATGVHLTTEYFAGVAGLKLNHVPYKGSAPLMVDIIGGTIEMVFTTLSTTSQHLASGRIRALAIAASGRAKNFPEIPTMTEVGYHGFEASTWHGFVTRSGVPGPIVTRLNGEIVRVLSQDDVRGALTGIGLNVGAGSIEAFDKFIRAEIDKWRKVATAAKVRLD